MPATIDGLCTGPLLAGTLPEEWAGPDLFKRLQFVYLQGNYLSGALPTAWASPDAFPALIEMCAHEASALLCGGARTQACALKAALLALTLGCRNLHGNNLTGTVPEEWGNEDAFVLLENL